MTCPLCGDQHSLSQCPRWKASQTIVIPIFKEMKMQASDITSMSKDIVEFLKHSNGENFGVAQISRAMNVGEAGMSKILRAMEDEGLIRGIHGIRQPRYYIATAEQIAAEVKAAQPRQAPAPLKIDRHRAELYAQLKEARDSIKSLHIQRV
jgi:DNA-binding MarR family transcriptional regulator